MLWAHTRGPCAEACQTLPVNEKTLALLFADDRMQLTEPQMLGATIFNAAKPPCVKLSVRRKQ